MFVFHSGSVRNFGSIVCAFKYLKKHIVEQSFSLSEMGVINTEKEKTRMDPVEQNWN